MKAIATKNRLMKYSLLIFIIITASACKDSRTDRQTKSESAVDHNELVQIESKPVNDLLDDGFYQEQKADPLEDSEQTREPIVSDTDSSETTIINTPSSNHNQDTSQDQSLVDNKSLVENLGFSEAQQVTPSVEELEQEPFCLNSSNTSQDQESIEDACRKISKRLASVKYAACKAAKLQLTGCSSVKGFPILMSEFSPIEERKPQGKILIVGGTHGDELTSVSVIIRWIEKLNRHHSGLFHWHLVPMMNPDGVLKSNATRTNENGVDLNRNMPSDDWDQNAIKYWVEKGGKDPRKYPGEAASSEPETQWLIDEIKNFKPDAIISVHAPYGVVDFDSLLLNTAPKSLGKLHLNLLGTYPGSLGNYAGINLNIPVITLELPHSWVMPSEKESTKIWEDIVSWLKENVNNEVAKN